MAGLKAFLTSARAAVRAVAVGRTVTVVMGNQASDADSMVSSIVYAYCLHWDAHQHKSGNSDGDGLGLFIPMMPIPRADFALLDYRAPAATRYSHRLRGFDDDWVEVPFGTPPAAAYTNLPSGDYRLELRAETGGLFPQTITLSTPIAVAPHWYETLWFRALCALAAVAAVVAIVALRTRLLRQRARRLEGLVDERTQALRSANDRLAALASTDPLTGIGNRRRFLESATQELDLARRHGLPVSLIIVDLDRFKSINDNYGHPVGDAVLKRAAEATVRACRPGDVVARFGGEELVVLLPETAAAAALAGAEEVRRGLAVPGEFEGQAIAITASAGVAEWRAPDETLASLIERADRALYEAKRTGRDRAVLAATG